MWQYTVKNKSNGKSTAYIPMPEGRRAFPVKLLELKNHLFRINNLAYFFSGIILYNAMKTKDLAF
jgi:hypothetical protein